ncbi:MAG: hypothetical protein R3E97_09780 [Candidatus Eisenbacteria bacterium]
MRPSPDRDEDLGAPSGRLSGRVECRLLSREPGREQVRRLRLAERLPDLALGGEECATEKNLVAQYGLDRGRRDRSCHGV